MPKLTAPIRFPPEPPTPAEVDRARLALASLPANLDVDARLGLPDITIDLPRPAVKVLAMAIANLAQGHAVDLFVPAVEAALTTQEAADYLRVSRPYLIKRMERGDLAFHMVGTHRRLKRADVLAFEQRLQAEQRGEIAPAGAPT